MVAVAASEEKNFLVSVFLRVQNVIAEPQSMNQQKEIKKETRKGKCKGDEPFTAKFHGTHLGNDEKGVAKLLDVPSSLLLGAPVFPPMARCLSLLYFKYIYTTNYY